MLYFFKNLFDSHICRSLAIFILIVSCETSTDKSELSGEQRADSILIWAKEGRYNDSLSNENRAQLLEKATKAIKNNTPDSLKLKYYSNLSVGYLDIEDSISFREYNRKLQQLAREMNDDNEFANSHWDLGNFFSDFALRDSAYYHYYQAHTIMIKLGDNKSAGTLLLNMAIQQSKARSYVESEQTTYKAIELLEKVEDTLQLFGCYNNLGTVTKELKEYERSLGFFDQAEEYLDMLNETKKKRYKRSYSLSSLVTVPRLL